jgi:CheY-like chemotaxis protein
VSPRSGDGQNNAAQPQALVIEDDAAIRHLVVNLVQDAGFQAKEAVDGAQALDLLADGLPDLALIIVDLAMPNVDGEAFLAELEGLYPGRPTVVVLSAMAPALVEQIAERWNVLAVTKPFEVDALSGTIASVLKECAG